MIAQLRPLQLAPGEDGQLWQERLDCGEIRFRDRLLRIEVPRSASVLFPTDCGLGLLAALDADESIEFAGKAVLDVGCGSGLYTVAMLAAGASSATALDLNPEAAAVTRANVARNALDLGALECVTANLAEFHPARTFDVVVSNPPHLPSAALGGGRSRDSLALVGGPRGRDLYDIIIGRITDLLAPDGVLCLAHSSLVGVDETIARMVGLGFSHRYLQVFELDIPLRSIGSHADALFAELSSLREAGTAEFTESRFFQCSMVFERDHDASCSNGALDSFQEG